MNECVPHVVSCLHHVFYHRPLLHGLFFRVFPRVSLKTSCGAFLASMRGVARASCVVSFIARRQKIYAKIFEFRLLVFSKESRAREKISSSPIPHKSQTAKDMGPQQRALKPSQILGAILLASLCLFVTYKSTYFASNALSGGGGGGGGDEKKIGRKKSNIKLS